MGKGRESASLPDLASAIVMLLAALTCVGLWVGEIYKGCRMPRAAHFSGDTFSSRKPET